MDMQYMIYMAGGGVIRILALISDDKKSYDKESSQHSLESNAS